MADEPPTPVTPLSQAIANAKPNQKKKPPKDDAIAEAMRRAREERLAIEAHEGPTFVERHAAPTEEKPPKVSGYTFHGTTGSSDYLEPQPDGDIRYWSDAPFPVGVVVRYVGTKRLFAGYECVPVVEPGVEREIVDVTGTYSVFVVDVLGVPYDFVISAATKSEWVVG